MTKTLADLAAQPIAPRRHVAHLCLAPEILDEIEALTAEHDRILVVPTEGEDVPPTRLAGFNNPRVKEIKARLAVLLDEMTEYAGDLEVRGKLTDGEWRRWVNSHPARGEDDPGHERDMRVTGGWCNGDDLIDSLGSFVHSWNGDLVDAETWANVIAPRISTADKGSLALEIVKLYEGQRDFLRRRSSLSTSLKKSSDSASPETSGSPIGDSTAGSPDSSTAATTETATESP